MSEIEKWLKKYDLSEYAAVFKANKIDFTILRTLKESDLERLGIHLLSDRMRLLRLIEKERNLRNMHFFFGVLSPGLAICLFFVPFFDFSNLGNAVYKNVSGVQMVGQIGAILKNGLENPVEKMYLFSMIILPVSILEIFFIVSLKQDDLLYKRGCGVWFIQLSIIVTNLYFIALSLGFNSQGIPFYEYGQWGYFTYLFLCFAELVLAVLTNYNSGDSISEDPKSEGEMPISEATTVKEPTALFDKATVKKMIARNQLQAAFDAINEYYSSIQKAEPVDFLVLKASYEEVRRLKHLGIVDHVEDKQENRIRLALLELVEQI